MPMFIVTKEEVTHYTVWLQLTIVLVLNAFYHLASLTKPDDTPGQQRSHW